MKYIKTFELFDFFKKSKKSNKEETWQEKFERVWSKYQKFKDIEKVGILDRPHVDIKDDEFSVSLGLSPHLCFYRKNQRRGDLVVIDFEECDYSNPSSDKGVYKITELEYNSYLKKVEVMNDWLDDLSEKETGKSDIDIDSSGEFELDEGELALDEANYKLKEEVFKEFIGETFEFEVEYHLWSSGSKNEKIVDRQDFKIDDITIGFGGGRFWAQIWTNDMFDMKSYLWIESDSNPNYIDFEKIKSFKRENVIRMNIESPEMSRKQQREADKNRKYPMVINYVVSPSKYNTIEFIKTITELLSKLNDQIALKQKM